MDNYSVEPELVWTKSKKNQVDQAELRDEDRVMTTLSGDLNLKTLKPVLKNVDKHFLILKGQNKMALLLVDVMQLEIVRLDSKKHGVQWLRRKHFDRISVYGSSTFMRYFVKMLVRAIAIGNNMRYFNDRESAVSWLNQ